MGDAVLLPQHGLRMGPSLHRIWNTVSHVNGLCFLVFLSVPLGSPRPLCSRFVPSCGVTASFTYLVFPCVLFHQPGAGMTRHTGAKVGGWLSDDLKSSALKFLKIITQVKIPN